MGRRSARRPVRHEPIEPRQILLEQRPASREFASDRKCSRVMRRADGQLRVVKLGSPRRLKIIGVKAVLQAFGDRAVSGTFPRENADLLAESELIGRLRTSDDDA